MASAGISLNSVSSISYTASLSSSHQYKQKNISITGDLFIANIDFDLKLTKLSDNLSCLNEVAEWIKLCGRRK